MVIRARGAAISHLSLFRPASWENLPWTQIEPHSTFPIWQVIKAAYIQIVIFDENDWLIAVKVHKETCQHLSNSRREMDFFSPG